MSNMSYCRFQNTSMDLADCYEALGELFEGSPDEPLSRDELEAAKQLVDCCKDILELFKGEAPDEFEDILEQKNQQAESK